MNTTGGANVMGSYPYPPNGMIEIDYEFILIFKKPGKSPKVPKEIKEISKFSKEEWKEYFSGHWKFPPAKQIDFHRKMNNYKISSLRLVLNNGAYVSFFEVVKKEEVINAYIIKLGLARAARFGRYYLEGLK